MWMRVLTAVVFCVFAAWAFWYALVHTVHFGVLAIPELRGLAVDEAERVCHDLGLQLAIEEPGVFSADIKPGTVAAQEPYAGFHVKEGSALRVRLSLGTQRVAVPDLSGESVQSATRRLQQLGLAVGYRAEVAGYSTADSVVATDPAAGVEVEPAREVAVLVNATPAEELWVMPSLLSQPLGQATQFCQRLRLRLGQVHSVRYPGLAGDVVVRQYPSAGSPLARTDIIALWVSQ